MKKIHIFSNENFIERRGKIKTWQQKKGKSVGCLLKLIGGSSYLKDEKNSSQNGQNLLFLTFFTLPSSFLASMY